MPFDTREASRNRGPTRMKLVAGNSNRPLAEAIAGILNLALTKSVVRRFADMEVCVEVQENMRGEDVYVLQSTSFPANDNLMELLILVDALKRSMARRITAVMPYFGYARQDRRPGPRTPETRDLFADWNVVGTDYFRTMRVRLVRGRDFSDADNTTAQMTSTLTRMGSNTLGSAPGCTGFGPSYRKRTDSWKPGATVPSLIFAQPP